MDMRIFDRILEAQEHLQTEPESQALWAEHEIMNARMLTQLETMTQTQRETVMDYFGLVIELHLRTLAFILEERGKGESE